MVQGYGLGFNPRPGTVRPAQPVRVASNLFFFPLYPNRSAPLHSDPPAPLHSDPPIFANTNSELVKRLALVSNDWHKALAPPAGARVQTITRRITLNKETMLTAYKIAQPWWRWVSARNDVTDAALSSLAAVCPTITTLDLGECDQITDAGLHSLAACRVVTWLDLSGCTQLRDASLNILAAQWPAMTTLVLADCCDITDVGLGALAVGCPALTTVDLAECMNITHKGLLCLASGCPALTILDLTSKRLTDNGLAHLAGASPAITILKLWCCPNITDAGLGHLAAACLAITELDLF